MMTTGDGSRNVLGHCVEEGVFTDFLSESVQDRETRKANPRLKLLTIDCVFYHLAYLSFARVEIVWKYRERNQFVCVSDVSFTPFGDMLCSLLQESLMYHFIRWLWISFFVVVSVFSRSSTMSCFLCDVKIKRFSSSSHLCIRPKINIASTASAPTGLSLPRARQQRDIFSTREHPQAKVNKTFSLPHRVTCSDSFNSNLTIKLSPNKNPVVLLL